jgi:hypothetical protein
MVETIQHMQVVSPPLDLPIPLIREWTTSWAGIPCLINLTKTTKLQEAPSNSPNKIISMEEIF